ncbi:hypothetical protein ABEB36_005131 [Hypothenemus hampei]|uniref:Endosome-associated-trafficking regulator 1 n=1 Tax=Hypothenemus hampei TaxID=57062 RepID=A0ABD1EXI2_HYPHA
MSKGFPQNNDESGDSDTEESDRPPGLGLKLDLGDNGVYNVDANRLGLQAASSATSVGQECSGMNPKREDNPFSFKHFLRDNPSLNKNYQSLGAKPKIYRENPNRPNRTPESPPRSSQRNIGDFSSVLPDFVQDHLVIEQCFLDHNHTQEVHRSNGSNNLRDESNLGLIPLDLPGLSTENSFPLDLPLAANVANIRQPLSTPTVEVGNSKSLPDFLTDGPVRSSKCCSTSPCTVNASENTRESGYCRKCIQLENQLTVARNRLFQTEQKIEENRKQDILNNRVIESLENEIESLKSQLQRLQAQNDALIANRKSTQNAGDVPLEQKLAHELRSAATQAEQSLKSLLSGVANLRMVASTLENMHGIEEESSNKYDDNRPAQ